VAGDLLGFPPPFFFRGCGSPGGSEGTRRALAGTPRAAGWRLDGPQRGCRSAVALVSKHLGFGIGSEHFFLSARNANCSKGGGEQIPGLDPAGVALWTHSNSLWVTASGTNGKWYHAASLPFFGLLCECGVLFRFASAQPRQVRQ
jgi:hypothetical protein